MREGGISDEELAAIKQRAAVASEARGARPSKTEPKSTLDEQFAAWFDDGPRKVADSADDVPALVAEIERLRALLHEVANYEDDLTTGPWPRVWAEFGVHAPEQQR